jgi:hypothetical protein
VSPIVLAVWTALGFASRPDAAVIADALVTAAHESPLDDLGEAGTIAVMADYAAHESGVQLRPAPYRGRDGKPVDGLAHGFLQLHGPAGLASPLEQARAWLRLAHDGERTCPDQPLGPLSGSCRGARRLADRRVREALDLAGLP